MPDQQIRVRLIADIPSAWRHQCGHLNDGVAGDDPVCTGCRCDARQSEITHRYLLVEMGP